MAYEYANGVLSVRRRDRVIALTDLVKACHRPVYIYDSEDILQRIEWYRTAFLRPVKVHFALKANPYLPLLKAMAQTRIGADVVSGGELLRALEAGFLNENIVFSGVGKSREELELAIRYRIGQVNVESLPELERIGEMTAQLSEPLRIALRLNPDVTPDTHHHITTGHRENKFGLSLENLPQAIEILRRHRGLRFFGLAMHVGSQIMDASSILEAVQRLKSTFLELRKAGWPLQSLDLGGGLGIDYANSDESADFGRLKNYAAQVEKTLEDLACEILLEPGRFLVARAGVLLTQIEYVKRTPHRQFVVVNSGMNHLMRPALYQAEHRILTLVEPSARHPMVYDIVGPICESTDVLGRDRNLDYPQSGDWLAVMDAGAYGFSMANQYNLRELPDQILL